MGFRSAIAYKYKERLKNKQVCGELDILVLKNRHSCKGFLILTGEWRKLRQFEGRVGRHLVKFHVARKVAVSDAYGLLML